MGGTVGHCRTYRQPHQLIWVVRGMVWEREAGTEWKGEGQHWKVKDKGDRPVGRAAWAGSGRPHSRLLCSWPPAEPRLIRGTSPKPSPHPRPLGLPVKVLSSMSLGPRVAADAQGQNAIKSAGRRVLGQKSGDAS